MPTPIAGASASIQPQYPAADSSGNVYFQSNNAIYKLSAGSVTRIAGIARAGFAGDNGPATSAQIGTNIPFSGLSPMTLDSAGNLYFIDGLRIRKVSANGTISTIAGTGQGGGGGDNGPAASATFSNPGGIAVDSAGNVYVSDTALHVVRRIAPNGTITRYAGTGQEGFGGDHGPATSAMLDNPQGLAVDSAGNLYIADWRNARIREVSTGGTIDSVAGDGDFALSGDNQPALTSGIGTPSAVAVDRSGTIYMVTSGLVQSGITNIGVIRTVSQGAVRTVAGLGHAALSNGQPASNAFLNGLGPAGFAVDSQDNIYFGQGAFLWKIGFDLTVTSIAGNGALNFSGDGGSATAAQLSGPDQVGFDAAGNMYIADSGNARIRKVDSSGGIMTIAGTGVSGDSGDGGPATKAQIQIDGMAVDKSGNVYIADTGHGAVRKITPAGISTVAGGKIGFSGDGGPATQAGFDLLAGVAVDSAGNIYTADNCEIRKVSAADGTISDFAGRYCSGACLPVGGGGDGGPASSATLACVDNIWTDSADNLYFGEESFVTGDRLRKISHSSGIISTIAGAGPTNFAADGSPATAENALVWGGAADGSGNVYFSGAGFADAVSAAASKATYRIMKIDPNGILTNLAGTLVPGYTGDGGPAKTAQVMSPTGMAMDSSGAIYFADSNAGAVRVMKLQTVAPPPTGPSITSVVNGASNLAGPIAPGELVVIFGSNLGPSSIVVNAPDANGNYPTQLAGTSVLFNGKPGPMFYTLAGQVAAFAPYEIPGAAVQVTVQYQGASSAPASASLAAANPAILTSGSGTGQAAAVNQDGTINGAAHPAAIGDVILLYATGEGVTNPPGVDGAITGSSLPKPVLPVSVTIGGQTLTPLYAGEAPGEIAGVMQLNVQIPVGIQTGNAVPVTIQVGSFQSQAGITIAVH